MGSTTTQLMDKEQLAKVLGVRRQEVPEILAVDGFPAPLGYFRGRHVWDAAAIEDWIERVAAAPEQLEAAV